MLESLHSDEVRLMELGFTTPTCDLFGYNYHLLQVLKTIKKILSQLPSIVLPKVYISKWYIVYKITSLIGMQLEAESLAPYPQSVCSLSQEGSPGPPDLTLHSVQTPLCTPQDIHNSGLKGERWSRRDSCKLVTYHALLRDFAHLLRRWSQGRSLRALTLWTLKLVAMIRARERRMWAKMLNLTI